MSEIRLPLQAIKASAKRSLDEWEDARCTAEDSHSCQRCRAVAQARWLLRITDALGEVKGAYSLVDVSLVSLDE